MRKDLRLAFDGNHYCVLPRYVGYRLTVKADASSLTHDQHQEYLLRPLLAAWRGAGRPALPERTVRSNGRRTA
jgi:hypothetical protein